MVKLNSIYIGNTIFLRAILFIIMLTSAQICIAKDYYGAIYVDESTGIAGSSWDYDSSKDAKRAALEICKKKSAKKSCEYISGFSNTCSAAAWSPKKKSARQGDIFDDLNSAEKSALAVCRRIEKDQNCKIVASVCTSWDTYKWWYIP